MSSDTLSPAPAPAVKIARPWTRFKAWVFEVPALQVMVVLALAAWLVITIPAIANPRSVTSILVITSLLALAAMGQTLRGDPGRTGPGSAWLHPLWCLHGG